MKKTSWRTTYGGIITAAGAALFGAYEMTQCPEWVKTLGVVLSIFGPALLGVSARDHRVSSRVAGVEPAPSPGDMRPKFMTLAVLALPLFLAVGCMSVNQKAASKTTTETLYPDGRKVTLTEEKTLASNTQAAGDAKAAVDKLRASNGKTLSMGASGVDGESSAQPLIDLFSSIFEAGRKAAKPVP